MMSIILSAKFLDQVFRRKEPHATLSFIYTKNSCIDFEKIQPKATKKQEINTKSCMCRTIFPNKTE